MAKSTEEYHEVNEGIPHRGPSKERKETGSYLEITRTNEDLPMNKKLWSKIKRKQRLWEKLNQMKEEGGHSEEEILRVQTLYRRTSNQVRRETRDEIQNKEKNIDR